MDKQDFTIEHRLAALGYGHRRPENSPLLYGHEIFRLSDGGVVGIMDASMAVEFINSLDLA